MGGYRYRFMDASFLEKKIFGITILSVRIFYGLGSFILFMFSLIFRDFFA